MPSIAAPIVTALYAGILGLVSIGIAVAVGRVRTSTGISIGDGGNLEMIAAMRRHANFIEFVPLSLILIGLLEANGVASAAIHGLGGGLVVARLAHAFGYRADGTLGTFRAIGAIGSTLILAVASAWAIVVFF
jgi:uncharacterized membrane protein YecN with MAPEG domain